MTIDDTIKLFAMSHQMAERDLDRLEERLGIDLQRVAQAQALVDEEYYPQFEEAIRQEASAMAVYYQLFYCLERSMRQLVREKLRAEKGPNWWTSCVPEEIGKSAAENLKREADSGVTPRSTEELDYTTFGELAEIVKNNWPSFADTFNSQKAFVRVMASLNILRAPIAHCCRLPPDETTRLEITIRDWFRLME
jgi:hypothetical protein